MNKKHPCEEPVRQRAGDFFKKHDPKGKTAEEDQYFFRFRRDAVTAEQPAAETEKKRRVQEKEGVVEPLRDLLCQRACGTAVVPTRS